MKLRQIAISHPNMKKRARAIGKLAKLGCVSELIEILNKSKYKDVIESTELALSAFNFK